ncbi:MAG: hypothetical protein IJF07_00910 [Lachnospiraceae bacterium]|nr:hypothetical protein [Lachnospiraceae bacterium]
MKKDTFLINIYLKIHNKQTLTLDDLRYLAQYAPECFEKTCKNVVYNIPETRPIMEPEAAKAVEETTISQVVNQQNIEMVLENLKRLEAHDFPTANVDVETVKSLLGNLYMELLFPHNDRDTFVNMPSHENTSTFDKRI